MRHKFATEQWVPYPKERLFAFFANPSNLAPLMPPWQKARIETMKLVPPFPASPGVVAGAGSRMIISFRPIPFLPVRLKWEAFIVEFHWNAFFCDEQRKGPFHYFRHCHYLKEAIRESTIGTVVMDAVDYELPFGLLGDLANQLVVKRQIRALFAHRQRTLPMLLSTY
jgi:ligand-binding SRPBCC domain-containing protein